MNTAKELREHALKYGWTYNPKPEAVEIVETMFNNCKLQKVDDTYTRITIRDMSCIINYPFDDIESKPSLISALLFYHRDILWGDREHPYETETEKSLRSTGYKFVEKYLNTYHNDYYDRPSLYVDYYDR